MIKLILFLSSRDYLLTLLMTFGPIRLEPYEDLTVHCLLNPIRTKDNGVAIIKVVGSVHKGFYQKIITKPNLGHHKTASSYGNSRLQLPKEIYQLSKNFLKIHKKTFPNESHENWLKMNVFCSTNGKPLKNLGGVIEQTTEKVNFQANF